MADGQLYRGVLRSFSVKDGYGFVRCQELLETFGRTLVEKIVWESVPDDVSHTVSCSCRKRTKGMCTSRCRCFLPAFAVVPASSLRLFRPQCLN